ncbi:MAG TPA: Rieske 2Fe-2S domain-containing protein [Chloroflexota bacterium]|jgi:phenylpropionate dioxygenase-like ring-hydroxylating dioxygenase large terminal subunit
MLSQEDNALVTRVGPGTPLGDMMRQYWVPALASTELPAPDCDPVRVPLLGEKLIAFRDSSGAVGLIGNSCPHRGASLFFGRNEECGLRCVYHGWKFDVTGQCVDMPSEPPESSFKHKIRTTAYPCRERGGIIWAYLGPRATPPPLPDIEPNMLADDDYTVELTYRECNWLQALEGDVDTSHLQILHLGSKKPEDARPGTMEYYALLDRAPRYEVIDTPIGTMYGAYRPAGDDAYYWRIAQYIFPFYTMIPTGLLGVQVLCRAWVPLDDEHTMFYQMASGSTARTLSGRRDPTMTLNLTGRGYLPNTTDWYGRFRMAQNKENDYLIDRDKQRRKISFTGIEGIPVQDQAVTESMGPIFDRGSEHLASTDIMIIRTRHRLLEAVKAFRDHGVLPPGAEDPTAYRVRSGGVILPKDADWVAATKQLREAFVEHPEIDLSVLGRND